MAKYLGIPVDLTVSYCNNFSGFFNDGKATDIDLKNISASSLKGYEGIEFQKKSWFGIDIPIWITKKGNKNKIMFIAMDPLREKDKCDKIMPENITFNTPFTMHEKAKYNNYNSHHAQKLPKYYFELIPASPNLRSYGKAIQKRLSNFAQAILRCSNEV